MHTYLVVLVEVHTLSKKEIARDSEARSFLMPGNFCLGEFSDSQAIILPHLLVCTTTKLLRTSFYELDVIYIVSMN